MAALIIAIMSSQFGSMNVTYTEKSQYRSGFDHGCDDAKISDANDRYINQPKRGSSPHTQNFMSGYIDGFKACGHWLNFNSSQDFSPTELNSD